MPGDKETVTILHYPGSPSHGKECEIVFYDTYTNEYKVEFKDGWTGWYKRQNLITKTKENKVPVFPEISPAFQNRMQDMERIMLKSIDDKDPDCSEKIAKLTERIDAMERLIKITFNNHVIINGRFVDMTNPKGTVFYPYKPNDVFP